MRLLLAISLSICLVLSISAVASAEVIRITPEVMDAELEMGDYSESGNIYSLSGELNFVAVRAGLDLGSGEFDDIEYTMTGVRIGTELPLVLFKLIAFGGYQNYKFESSDYVDADIKGTVFGVGLERKLNKFFSIRGVFTSSLDMEADDEKIDFSGVKLDCIFTTAPLVDFFAGYRSLRFENDDSELEVSGLAAGVRLGI